MSATRDCRRFTKLVTQGLDKKGRKRRKMVFKGTTILSVRHRGGVAIGGDGQVSIGETVVKNCANKIRRMYNDQVISGFAGSVADSLTLFQRLEERLSEYKGNLPRACVELAREWRTDKFLRRLEAQLVVVDKDHSFLVSGSGEVFEPDDGIIAIGSGGPYALAAARALTRFSRLTPREIVREALLITSRICIYTNNEIIVEGL
jgi:ATP-dependent HslUV protease subunit HslV